MSCLNSVLTGDGAHMVCSQSPHSSVVATALELQATVPELTGAQSSERRASVAARPVLSTASVAGRSKRGADLRITCERTHLGVVARLGDTTAGSIAGCAV